MPTTASTKRCALVVLRASGRQTPLPAAILRQLFGLTWVEAQLATDLVAGYSTAEVAERMRVTRETLRSYLKQIYTKTGVHRQAELVGLVLNGPAVFTKESDH